MALNLGMTPLLAILCLGFCCVVSGRSFFDSPFGNDLENVNTKKGVDVLMQQLGDRHDGINGCSCNKTGCFCCKNIEMPAIQFQKNCCFGIEYNSRSRNILTLVQIGKAYELMMLSAAGDLPFIGGCVSPRVKGGLVGFQLEILSNSTSGLTACAYLAVSKPQLVSMGCFGLRYTANVQSDEDVQGFRQDSETIENDMETVYEKKELYTQMKRSLFMNKEN